MSEHFCYQMSIAKFIENNFKDIRAPFLTGIELTAKCNLKCVHCYAKNGVSDHDMTTEEVFHIIDILCQNGTLGVYFTGGEIFTRSDFIEIYLYAKRKGLSISLLSNITLLNERHIKLFQEYPVSEISTTVYGITEETYEKVTGVKGSFTKFIRALNLLKQNHIPVSLKFVVVKENKHEVYQAQEFAKQYNCRMLTAFAIHAASDGDSFPIDHRVAPKESFEFDVNDDKRKKFWSQVASDLALEQCGIKEPHHYVRKEQGYLYPCDISWHSTFISHTGMMQACTKVTYNAYDLLHGDFAEGWDYLNNTFRKKKAPEEFPCIKCPKFHYCEQCTANFMCDDGTLLIDSFYCETAEYRKKYVEELVLNLSTKEE